MLKELDYLNESEVKTLVDDLFAKSRKYSAMSRSYITTKARTKKKMDRVQAIEKENADIFNKVYQSVLINHGIRSLVIKPTDSRYITMKEVAAQADEFCELFNFKKESGYRKYVELGIDVLGRNFNINRLRGAGDRIVKRFQEYLVISESDRDKSNSFYSLWKATSYKYTSRSESITEPHLYVHFIYGYQAADEAEAPYSEWIEAQFERWASMGSTPELSQFYGDNAKLAYMKYCNKYGKQNETAQDRKVKSAEKIPIKEPKTSRSRNKA